MDWIARAAERHPEAQFGDGDVLIREGAVEQPLLVLLDGPVAVFRGTVRVNRSAERGALFGEMSALLGIPSSASVIAEGAVRALRIEDGRAFLGSDPQIALHSARLLAQRLYDATTYLADLKEQYGDQQSHLGMVDRILGSLLNQQVDAPPAPEAARRDPRL
jgi:CRP-like cAMP-binding protein